MQASPFASQEETTVEALVSTIQRQLDADCELGLFSRCPPAHWTRSPLAASSRYGAAVGSRPFSRYWRCARLASNFAMLLNPRIPGPTPIETSRSTTCFTI